MSEYRHLNYNDTEEDAVPGGHYVAQVIKTVENGYALVALNRFRDDIDAKEMETGNDKTFPQPNGAVTAMLHTTNMGVVDPIQLTVGDQVAVRVHEYTDDGPNTELIETIDVTRQQIANETGPAYGKTPVWEKEEGYVCDVCGEDLPTEKGLAIHKGQMHKDEEAEDDTEEEAEVGEYSCPECDETFDTPQGIAAHKRAHSDEMHPCPVCGKECETAQALGQHKRVHSTDELRYAEEAEAETGDEMPEERAEPEGPMEGSIDAAFADGSGASLDDYHDVSEGVQGEVVGELGGMTPEDVGALVASHDVPPEIVLENADLIAQTLVRESATDWAADILLAHATKEELSTVLAELIYTDALSDDEILAFKDALNET